MSRKGWIQWLVACAVLVYLLSLGALQLIPVRQPTPDTAEPWLADRLPRPMVGFSLSVHHTDQLPLYFRAIDEIQRRGFNTLQIVTPVFQTSGADPSVRVEVGPDRGPHPSEIVALLRYAKARGLSTALMPIVHFTQPRGSEWRGEIQPEDWDAWWDAYTRAALQMAAVAQEAEADLFYVGSELLSTERQAEPWRELIARTRRVFDGALSYSANWDRYANPPFWPQLDVIAVNAYWDVSRGADHDDNDQATAARANWRRIQESLFKMARQFDRPVLISEVGYPSLPWAMSKPWNYVAPQGQAADHEAQARAYRALLAAWVEPMTAAAEPDAPLLGMVFYHWDPYHQGGEQDTGYGVEGKPALPLIEGWLERLPMPDAE